MQAFWAGRKDAQEVMELVEQPDPWPRLLRRSTTIRAVPKLASQRISVNQKTSLLLFGTFTIQRFDAERRMPMGYFCGVLPGADEVSYLVCVAYIHSRVPDRPPFAAEPLIIPSTVWSRSSVSSLF